MKKILCLLLCLCMMLPAVTSCSKAPEYSEIEDRLKELIEASYEINEIFFGLGLATYERVSDPRASTKLYSDEEHGVSYYYFVIPDPTLGNVIALQQKTTTKKYEQDGKDGFYYTAFDRTYGNIVVVSPSGKEKTFCMQILDAPIDGKTPDYTKENRYYYKIENYSYKKIVYLKPEKSEKVGGSLYYHDEEIGIYYYQIKDYVEPTYETYYTLSDPTDYDYVRVDTGYLSIAQIKESASKVYSAEYLNSIYQMMFDGAAGITENSQILLARYMEYTDPDTGEVRLMKSNTFEPLIKEKRLYDFSTAKIVRPKNGKYVTIEIESYLESTPDDRLTVKLGLKLQDGEWMLDSATY